MLNRTDAQIRKIAKRRAMEARRAQRAVYRKGARTFKALKSAPEPTDD